jgi:hypothetical protein
MKTFLNTYGGNNIPKLINMINETARTDDLNIISFQIIGQNLDLSVNSFFNLIVLFSRK